VKPRFFLIFLLLLPLGLWGGYRLFHPVPTLAASQVQLVSATLTPFQEEIRGLGELLPKQEHWVIASVTGTISTVLAHAGDQVRADTILLELVNPAIHDAYQQARFDWQQAKAQALSTQADLDIQLEQIESDLAMAKLEYEVRKKLQEKKITSTMEIRKRALTVEILQRRLKKTREAAIAKNEAARIQVEQKKQAMQAAELKVKALSLHAGVPGLLLKMEKHWKPGMVVKEGQSIARIATDHHLFTRIRVPVVSARNLAPGLEVNIDSRQHQIKGRILHILPEVENDEQVLEVSLPDKLPPSFHPNQPVRAQILLPGSNKRLTLPLLPELSSRGEIRMFRLSNDHWLEAVQVRLGRKAGSRVEVLSGLKPDDQVLVNPPEKWRDETRIRLVPRTP